MKRTRARQFIVFVLSLSAAFLFLSSCAPATRVSSLRIGQIAGAPLGLHIALNSNQDLFGSTQTQTASYNDPSGTSTPAVLMENIVWLPTGSGDDNSDIKASEFWLIIAEDTNANGSFDPMDRAMPAMKVTLRDTEETTIGFLDFGQASSNVTTDTKYFTINLFMAEPDAADGTHAINQAHPVWVEVYDDAGKTTFRKSFIFYDPVLINELRFRVDMPGSPFVFVYWDKDASGGFNAGDYYSSVNMATARPVADGYNDPFLLSNMMVHP